MKYDRDIPPPPAPTCNACPAKYRKRPIVITAQQWFPGVKVEGVIHDVRTRDDRYVIQTLEGFMELTPGDWVITGIKGEKYPCKPDIFAATYEPVD